MQCAVQKREIDVEGSECGSEVCKYLVSVLMLVYHSIVNTIESWKAHQCSSPIAHPR